ncbi:MAG: hypothetical protein P4L57_12580 [Rhizomicrobium sp.]|nr:hypothetical protein [Rhizomicrobium sp.]
MTKKTADDIRDYAMQGFRVYQDLIHAAGTRRDLESVRFTFDAFNGSFERFLERPAADNAAILALQMEGVDSDEERAVLQGRLATARTLQAVADSFNAAKRQIAFMLTAKFLEQLLQDDDPASRDIYEFLTRHLPQGLAELTHTFKSVSDRDADDDWGWHWWDFNPDGRVHNVDSTSRPNRLFVVRSLQILADLGEQVALPALPHDEDLVWLFDENNGTGVPAMVKDVQAQWDKYSKVLSTAALAQADQLLGLLAESKKAQEAEREKRLIESPLSPQKVAAFKENVVSAVQKESNVRALASRLGIYCDRTSERPGKDVPSWGYNQLDDKGAFIDDWHVSFSGWGEAYGRGMAQTEQQRFLGDIVKGAGLNATVKGGIVSTIEKHFKASHFEKPIILHSLTHTFEFSEIGQNKLFVPKYSAECPRTILTGLDGYSGVLRLGGADVPVFSIFAQAAELRNKVIIAEMQKYIRWNQFSPADENGEDGDILDFVYIKVADLNADNVRREKLLTDNPAWLHEKADKEGFLRAHTVVNVYEKLSFEIANANSAICLSVVSKRRGELE